MQFSFGEGRPKKGIRPPGDPAVQSRFQPLPPPSFPAPYRLDLKSILPASVYEQICSSKWQVFHTVGDVGGVKNPADQVIVADKMEAQLTPGAGQQAPSFLYLLGDVVYYYGQAADYNSQFFEPYRFYNAPIFAIPGNHDGDIDPTDPSKPKSLAAFVSIFCSEKPVIPPEAGDAPRTTLIQPNVYWTLVTPFANIIGMYTNVPEGGVVQNDQAQWLAGELKAAGKEKKQKALILALHHPPYSVDAHHGASTAMQQVLDQAFKASAVLPHLVLTGHVHNYQRFTRTEGASQIPYIVAGGGGYWNLHNINTAGEPLLPTPSPAPFAGTVIEKYCEDRHGFLRITIDGSKMSLLGEYFTVPTAQEPASNPAVLFDQFTIDLLNNKVQ